jgi:hypothetical protein
MRALGIAVVIFIAVLMLASVPRGHARDLDGRYQHSEYHEWVKSLHSMVVHVNCFLGGAGGYP